MFSSCTSDTASNGLGCERGTYKAKLGPQGYFHNTNEAGEKKISDQILVDCMGPTLFFASMYGGGELPLNLSLWVGSMFAGVKGESSLIHTPHI